MILPRQSPTRQSLGILPLLFAIGCDPTASSDKAPTSPADTDTAATLDTGTPNDTSGDTAEDSGDAGDDSGDTAVDTGDLPIDADHDGHPAESDCDDTNPDRYPGAPEICGDGLINDCDGDVWTASVDCEGIATDVDALATWTMATSQSDGIRVTGVGDLNGDGYDDIALGSPTWTNSEIFTGGIALYDGPVAGEYLPGDESHRFLGTERWDSIGWDITGLGDLDGDGYDDFAVGAADDHQNGERVTGTPSVYVVHGPGQLADIGEAVPLVDTSASLECLGSVLAPLSDANADGVTDLLVAGRCDNVVRLFSGAETATQIPGTDDLANFTGPTEESRFGHAMATGDLNGDGQADVVIGDPAKYSDFLGEVYLFEGPFSGTFDHASAAGTIEANPSYGFFEKSLLGSGVAIGDLNNDGYDDWAVGDPYYTEFNSERQPEGIVGVFFGPISGTLLLTDADFRMKGEVDHLSVGGEMRSGKDLDGDGNQDLLLGNGYNEINGVGATRYTFGFAAYMLRAPLPTGTITATEADYLFTDDTTITTDLFGQQTHIAGDTNADGAVEVLVGNWYDTIHLFDIPYGY